MDLINLQTCASVELSDEDVLAAMKSMQGYIDITPADFREIYRSAYSLAWKRLTSTMQAGEVMTVPVHVVRMDTNLIETASLLAEKAVSGVPVTDDNGQVIGMVSEKDFLFEMGAEKTGSFMEVIVSCLTSKGCLAAPMSKRTARDIMTSPAVTATADVPLGRLSKLMIEKNINRIPILDAAGKAIGIVTRSDLVTSFCMLG